MKRLEGNHNPLIKFSAADYIEAALFIAKENMFFLISSIYALRYFLSTVYD